MTAKEKFLQIKTYEEFDRRREEFMELDCDKEVIKHLDVLFAGVQNPPYELYKKQPK